jgi:hypothetical protein
MWLPRKLTTFNDYHAAVRAVNGKVEFPRGAQELKCCMERKCSHLFGAEHLLTPKGKNLISRGHGFEFRLLLDVG